MSSRHRWYGVAVVAAVVVMPIAVAVQSGSTEDGSAFATADWPFIGHGADHGGALTLMHE
ncbi:MAG: hypothetical protein V3T48_05465 [Vicinamibacterales bacterium]